MTKQMDKQQASAWLDKKIADGDITYKDLGDYYYNSEGNEVRNIDLDAGESIIFFRRDGAEGDQAPVAHIFKVTVLGEEFYFRVNGVYNSWDESHWDHEYEIVEPREVKVIQFFAR